MPRKKQNHILTAADKGYTEFLKSIELIGIALINSEFRIDRDKYFEADAKRLSVAWRCRPTETSKGCFDADAHLNVKLTTPKKPEPIVEINATFRMHIHAAKLSSRVFVDRFADSDVRLVIWPYFREYVTSICGRMHVPPIILPVSAKD